jgi:ribosome production factor 1
MVKSDKIANAFKRSEVHRKGKRDKEQEKLKRRMETRKAEAGEGGEELKRVGLSSSSSLTSRYVYVG